MKPKQNIKKKKIYRLWIARGSAGQLQVLPFLQDNWSRPAHLVRMYEAQIISGKILMAHPAVLNENILSRLFQRKFSSPTPLYSVYMSFRCYINRRPPRPPANIIILIIIAHPAVADGGWYQQSLLSAAGSGHLPSD